MGNLVSIKNLNTKFTFLSTRQSSFQQGFSSLKLIDPRVGTQKRLLSTSKSPFLSEGSFIWVGWLSHPKIDGLGPKDFFRYYTILFPLKLMIHIFRYLPWNPYIYSNHYVLRTKMITLCESLGLNHFNYCDFKYGPINGHRHFRRGTPSGKRGN